MDTADTKKSTKSSEGDLRTLLIVLSFHGAQDTLDCLTSIYCDKPTAADVLVVDNAPNDGTVEILRHTFPALEILELAENSGWAGGNNAGIKLALERGYDLLCLMNNDITVDPGTIDRLIEAASSVGPGLMHPRFHDHYAPDVVQHNTAHDQTALPGHLDIHLMHHAYGACMMVHADLFKRVGLFDERFFLQLEETDFYTRAEAMGFAARVCLQGRVLHKESVSFGGKVSPTKTYYMLRNQLLFGEKHASGITGRIEMLRRMYWGMQGILGSNLNAWRVLRWLCSNEATAIAGRAGIRDYVMRRFGKMPEATANILRTRMG